MKSKVRSSFSWFLSILLVLTMMPAMALTAHAVTQVSLEWSTTTEYPYNGEAHGPTATADPTAAEITITYAGRGSTTYPSSTTAPTAVGTYTATAALVDGSSYEFATTTETTQDFAITAVEVSLEWSTTTEYTYNGEAHGPTATADPTAAAITVTYEGTGSTTYPSSTTAPTAVGTYTATAALVDDTNYEFATTTETTQNFAITAVEVGLEWPTTTEYTYNGAAQGPTATADPTAAAITVTYEGTGSTTYPSSTTAPTAVGTYTATAALVDDTNYEFATTTETTQTFTIVPKPLAATWFLSGSKIDPTTSGGNDYELTWTGEDLKDSLAVTVSGVIAADESDVEVDGASTTTLIGASTIDDWNLTGIAQLKAVGDTGTATAPTLGGTAAANYSLANCTFTVVSASTPSTTGGGGGGRTSGGIPATNTTPTTTPTETPVTTPTEVVNPTPTTTPTDSSKATVAGFNDVTADKYYAEPVRWAVSAGITKGTSATEFEPNASCTRGQMVTFMWRAEGCPEPAATTTGFTDVKSDAYYAKAVQWAVGRGITNGLTATSFGPDETVDRGQTVTFLYRANGGSLGTSSSGFADVDPGAYYAEAVGWAAANGITTGTTASTFSPSDDCNRAQIVTFLYRANN